MDKKTFTSELEQALSVLQEEELKDIISEYEQHIDMKRERGLTEEEAIADFGSLDELAGEILEAYHVRADYAADKKGRRGRRFLRVGSFWKDLGDKLRKRISGWGRGWKDPVRKEEGWREPDEGAGEKEGNPETVQKAEREKGEYTWKKEGPKERRSQGKRGLAKGFEGRKGRGRSLGRVVGDLFRGGMDLAGRMAGFCIWLVLWGMRMAWNAGWIGFALCCGGLGLFSLFGLGMLTVLLLQGYPLAGVTLGCLGLVMCFFSAGCLGLTFLWKKRGRGADYRRDAGRMGEEKGQKGVQARRKQEWEDRGEKKEPEEGETPEASREWEREEEKEPQGGGALEGLQDWEERGKEEGQQEMEGSSQRSRDFLKGSCQESSREEGRHA